MEAKSRKIEECPDECHNYNKMTGECHLLLNSYDIDNIKSFFEDCFCKPILYMDMVARRYLNTFSLKGVMEPDDIVHDKVITLLSDDNPINSWFEKRQGETGFLKRDQNTLRAFLHTVIRNAVIDTTRKPVYRIPHEDIEISDTSEGVDHLGKNILDDFSNRGLEHEKMTDLLDVLMKMQDELGPKYVQVFVSHYCEKAQIKDLAAQYKVSRRAISRWISKSRSVFIKYWGSEK